MASISALRKQVKSIQPAGRIIVCFEGEPVPPHTDKDILVVFEPEDMMVL